MAKLDVSEIQLLRGLLEEHILENQGESVSTEWMNHLFRTKETLDQLEEELMK